MVAITSSGRWADLDACRCCLARILALALVFGKCVLENLLCVRHSFHKGHWHLKLAIANGTDCGGGDGTYPFDHSQIAFPHGELSHRRINVASFVDFRLHPATSRTEK